MENEIEQMCKQMTKDRLKRLLEGLHGLQGEVCDIETENTNQNKEKMASFAEVVSKTSTYDDTHDDIRNKVDETRNQTDPSDLVKPIFLKDVDVHGSVKPPRSLWLTNVEIYKAIDNKVPAERIKGIQRIREMWRIYLDNEGDRLSLLVSGINLRGRQVALHSQNPRNPGYLRPDTIRITVKNVPISADDGQVHRSLTLQGCDIQGLFRERLRVNGKLTNCQTGNRVVISKLLDKPIPRSLQIGKYMAIVMHSGQPEFENKRTSEGNIKTCHKCLKAGHLMYECTNEWVCRTCKLEGHKMVDCPNAFSEQSPRTPQHDDDLQVNQVDAIQTTEIKTSATTRNSSDNTQKQNTSNKQGKNNTEAKTTNSDKSQSSMDKFVKTPVSSRRTAPAHHTPPTPTESLHDKTAGNKGPKKAKS